ncbi:MAG: M14 family metallopeptidase, partial [Actinomycetota bacterium]|nr:M14 family metallopeptidase [Actinomycetota bacterium]
TQPERVVRVIAPTRAERRRLAQLGLDPAESGRDGAVDVVLHDAGDAAKLRAAGLRFTVRIANLGALERANRRADRRFAQRTARSSLPSARDTYRHLADYDAELKALALAHPGLVKLIVLPHRSLQGRAVLGVEIARNVDVARGQPVMLQLGAHHAREWPSAELPMEWARELAGGYGVDARITRLVDATRTIVVPVVNPDGFNLSREWPVDLGVQLDEAGMGFQYKRRNCRISDGAVPGPGQCEALANRRLGVDLNRNYGGFWGGPGASTDVRSDTYRGAGPFSEPEAQNVRELVSAHQVTTLITNHTFGNLVLRPPGIAAAPQPRDENLLRSLGDAMAARNGYASQPAYVLYDASGGTEDWSYHATGGLGYTFEHGATQFHPPFAEVVGQYANNREAFFVALESTANRARHAVVRGRARAGTVVRVRKEFDTNTAPVLLNELGTAGAARSFHDVLSSTMTVGATGRFEWHLNPSTRPAVSGTEAWNVTCERPAGSVRARGRLRIARGQRKALDLCGLSFSVALKRRAVRSALRRGLRARARCSSSCRASLTLTMAASSARRHGLTKRRSGRIVVARAARKRAFSGRRTFTVRFTPSARRRLAGTRRLRLRMSALARNPSDKRRISRTIVLER